MKFLHTSDLHLGKRLGEFRLYEEQSAMLDWLVRTAGENRVDGLLLAGDIYDRSVPPVEAVALFDRFLAELAERSIPLFAISGNHDSPERIAYGSRLLDRSGIHLSTVFHGDVRCVRLERGDETAYIHLLPFLRPVHVRTAYAEETDAVSEDGEPDTERETPSLSYTEAMARVISRMVLPADGDNILLCHQFITGSLRSESEEVPLVGTLDAVDAAVFAPFAYTALGHLHRAQQVAPRIRYAGSPLAYAFSETEEKGCVLAELRGGQVQCTFLPMPRGLVRGLTTLTGTYDTLISRSFRESCPAAEDYLRIVLEEDTPVPDAMAKLSLVYPRVVQLAYRKTAGMPTEELWEETAGDTGERLTPQDVFAAFYKRQNETDLSEEDRAYICALLGQEEGETECGR